MIITIHQPQFMPWLGYFDKMDQADLFVFLDNVQFKKNEWQNRNKIKTAQGWQWITVPVRYRFPQKINEVLINNNVNWHRKHLEALATNYSKTPFFRQYIHFFQDFYANKWDKLVDVNVEMIKLLKDLLNIESRTLMASGFIARDRSTDRLVDICKAIGADTYISGPSGANYIDFERFQAENIHVLFHDFHHPSYPQLYGDFLSHMSVIDILFNCGPESLSIIRRGRRPCKTL